MAASGASTSVKKASSPIDTLSGGAVFVILSIVILVLSFITLIVLATSIDYHKKGAGTDPYPSLCSDPQCLRDAAIMIDFMNLSVDPCEDFYGFVCGNFDRIAGRSWDTYSVTIQDLVELDVNAKVEEILKEEAPKDEDSAEWKAKTFYQTCTDEFLSTNFGAKVLSTDMTPYGGWYPIDTINENVYKFSTAVPAAHRTFGVGPFFEIEVAEDDASNNPGVPALEYIIQLRTPRLGFDDWSVYLVNDTTMRDEYKDYLRTIINMIREELNKKTNTFAVEKGAQDILYMEVNIAEILKDRKRTHGNYISIGELQNKYGGMFDFPNLFKQFFKGADLPDSTMIHLDEEDYISRITTLLPTIDKRILNTYIMWRVVANYINDLGTAYIHAAREWEVEKYGKDVNREGVNDRCIRLAKENFGHSISNLFVTRHFGPGDNAQINDQGALTIGAFMENIKAYSWMTNVTRSAALDKVKNSHIHFGYPVWIDNVTEIDSYYSGFKVNDKSHFTNMMNAVEFRTNHLTKLLEKKTIDRSVWPELVTSTYIEADQVADSIFAPAGALQPPIWDYSVPQYVNYGSLGRWLGQNFVKLIDYEGNNYNKDGVFKRWYDEETSTNYEAAHQCMEQFFENITDNAYNDAYYAMEEAGGLRMSYQAYKSYVKDNKEENQVFPGLQDYSSEQGFMIAFGQSFCESRSLSAGGATPRDRLAVVLSQSKDFEQVFQCPNTSPYIGKKKCPGF